jgi:hypothetical protein
MCCQSGAVDKIEHSLQKSLGNKAGIRIATFFLALNEPLVVRLTVPELIKTIPAVRASVQLRYPISADT